MRDPPLLQRYNRLSSPATVQGDIIEYMSKYSKLTSQQLDSTFQPSVRNGVPDIEDTFSNPILAEEVFSKPLVIDGEDSSRNHHQFTRLRPAQTMTLPTNKAIAPMTVHCTDLPVIGLQSATHKMGPISMIPRP